MNEHRESIVVERTTNRNLFIGLAVAAALLIAGLLAFMMAGPGRGSGANQTNVNLSGQGQGQQPSALQINVNLTVQAQASLTAVPTTRGTATTQPTSQVVLPPPTQPARVEVLVITATELPTQSPTRSPTESPTPSPTPSLSATPAR